MLLQQFLFSRVCFKKRQYHAAVNKYAMELLEEKKKQGQLRAQIQSLKKTYLNQNERSSQEFNITEVLRRLHLDAEVAFETMLRQKDLSI